MTSSTFLSLAVVGLALTSFLIYERTSKSTTFPSGASPRARNRLVGSSRNTSKMPRSTRWRLSGRTNSTYRQNRRLSLQRIAGYEPTTQVTDFNAIDLDQFYLEEQLALNTEEGFDDALRIYTEGAYSKSVAEITLRSPLPNTVVVEKGDQVRGETASGDSVIGRFLEDYAAGETNIGIQYMTSDIQDNYVNCQVGASPAPNTEGCLAPIGTLTFSVQRVELPYTYDPLANNVAKRSISSFSLNADETMLSCGSCPYKMFNTFLNYYGLAEYGNEIISAAFESRQTNLVMFNNDFSQFSREARGEVIKIATAHIVVLMEVIRRMEVAIDDCQSGCSINTCNDDRVESIDVAVALYTGSLVGTDGSGSGVFSYELADEMCGKFKTCGDTADSTEGTSRVNIEIFNNFDSMRAKLANEECASSRIEKETIESLMLIPLIQGTLESAYIQATASNELSQAQGVGFSLAVVPAIYSCDQDAESIIATNMIAGQRGEDVDFASTKAAFESNYNCLGIDPAMVGGLYDSDAGAYFVGAEPSTIIATEETAVPTVAPTETEPSEEETVPSSGPTTQAPSASPAEASASPAEASASPAEASASPTEASASPTESPSSSPTTFAPTTPAPIISVAPMEVMSAVPTIDTNSTLVDDEITPTPAPSTPAPSASVFPTELTGPGPGPGPGPEQTDPGETGTPPTNSPSILSAAPIVDTPTAAPELRSSTVADLIMGPTPQLEKLGSLPTPASLKYVSTNVQRPSTNILPLQ